MFSAIGKLFRTIGYLLTGRIDRVRQVWGKNPDVIAATYDKVVTDKRARLNQYKNAVGGMIANEERKKLALKTLTDEVVRLDKLKSGALAKAKQIVAKYTDPLDAKNDPEYIKCQAANRDFSSTLDEKNARISELETDIGVLEKDVAGHKTQIESLMRDLEKVKNEKYETISDIVSAEEKRKVADMFSGISEDKTDQELAEMRELRTRAKADARMSGELAGLDSKRSEEEFLAYATENVVDDEFDKLLGLTKKETTVTVSAETKLSEI